jgi:hypothetical protein
MERELEKGKMNKNRAKTVAFKNIDAFLNRENSSFFGEGGVLGLSSATFLCQN